MFRYLFLKLFIGLAIVAVVLLSFTAVISAQGITSSGSSSRIAPLDWYLAHDHAVLDGDNNVLFLAKGPTYESFVPLDWYSLQDPFVFDEKNQ